MRDLYGKKVVIQTKAFGTASATRFEGTVIGIHNPTGGAEMFIQLDTGDMINARYIAYIHIND